MGLTATFISLSTILSATSIAIAANAGDILIESFASPTHTWESLNDPVMGGESTGTVKLENELGVFDGEVVDVPFLNAPGFITMETRDGSYPDVSSCNALKMVLMACEEYDGYRVSFGNAHVPGGRYAYGYKANFEAPLGSFGEIVIPFDEFTDNWNDATGNPIVTCKEDSQYCPDKNTLQNMQTISLWGEGVAGIVSLQIRSISASDCTASIEVTSDESQIKKEMNQEIGKDILVTADEIQIESFASPMHTWQSLNDPVMGGESTGTVKIENELGVFDGEVVDVPFLNAPGFITMETRDGSYPDVSSCNALKMVLMATEEYDGYRVSFGNVHLHGKRHAYGYKADFEAPVGSFDDIVIPFDDFSSDWSEYTGDQIMTCKEDSQYCPDKNTLQNMHTISLWGEGVAGIVHLQIKSISAIGCARFADAGKYFPRETTSLSQEKSFIPKYGLCAIAGVGLIAVAAVVLFNRSRRSSNYERIGEGVIIV